MSRKKKIRSNVCWKRKENCFEQSNRYHFKQLVLERGGAGGSGVEREVNIPRHLTAALLITLIKDT